LQRVGELLYSLGCRITAEFDGFVDG
jgi:hypothetical protein